MWLQDTSQQTVLQKSSICTYSTLSIPHLCILFVECVSEICLTNFLLYIVDLHIEKDLTDAKNNIIQVYLFSSYLFNSTLPSLILF